MNLELTISKQSDPAFNEKVSFNKFPVLIGREEKNDVILSDPFKVVSRRHAKIVETEGILQVVDLEAANFTYLNDAKLTPNDENALKPGDKIKIGEFELLVDITLEKHSDDDDDQKTMVFSSPYAEEINNLVDSIKTLSAKFAFDESPGKLDMLRFSILQSFSSLEKSEVSSLIAEYFSEHFSSGSAKGSAKHSPSEKSEVKIESKPEEYKTSFTAKEQPQSNSSLPPEYLFSSQFSNTTDILLDAFSTLIQGFLQFRQEFFGVTIYHTLPVGSVKELKEFLFTPDISPDDEKKRLNLLKEESQKLLSHQIGLLEGYRASITDGSKAMLQSLDPEIIEKDIQAKNAQAGGINIGKVLPFSQKSKVLDQIKDNFARYLSDPYHIEKKFFRPSFMKGYQKRISSSGKLNEY